MELGLLSKGVWFEELVALGSELESRATCHELIIGKTGLLHFAKIFTTSKPIKDCKINKFY